MQKLQSPQNKVSAYQRRLQRLKDHLSIFFQVFPHHGASEIAAYTYSQYKEKFGSDESLWYDDFVEYLQFLIGRSTGSESPQRIGFIRAGRSLYFMYEIDRTN